MQTIVTFNILFHMNKRVQNIYKKFDCSNVPITLNSTVFEICFIYSKTKK